MAKRKRKHQFHCEICGSPCEIYRKGKNHRVLVCPNCGVLATNPTTASKILRGLTRSVPVVGNVASEVLFSDKENKDTSPVTRSRRVTQEEKLLMYKKLYG